MNYFTVLVNRKDMYVTKNKIKNMKTYIRSIWAMLDVKCWNLLRVFALDEEEVFIVLVIIAEDLYGAKTAKISKKYSVYIITKYVNYNDAKVEHLCIYC